MPNKDKKKKNKLAIIGIIIFVLSFVAALMVLIVVSNGNNNGDDSEEQAQIQEDEPEVEDEPVEEEIKVIEKIDFQDVVDDWVATTGGRKGVIIYDLDAGEISAEYNADTKFATASIYKLFVVYEGYRRIQNGEWSGDDAASWTGYNISECLDLAIRESNSSCAEIMWSMIGRDTLDEIVQRDFEIPGVEISTLTATPREIMEMMKKFYYHNEIVDETLVSRMKDSFLIQPETIYDWRQGLPSGFSEEALVYNKVGWNYNGEYWDIYDDAAIIDFVNKERKIIVVVMTSGIDFRSNRRLGEMIEAKVLNLESN